MKIIEIVPAEGGWMMRSDAVENAAFFRSGASAESAAVRLAQGLADAGHAARVQIFIRDGSLARQFVVPSLRLVTSPGPVGQPNPW
jgi:hypothetical protein